MSFKAIGSIVDLVFKILFNLHWFVCVSLRCSKMLLQLIHWWRFKKVKKKKIGVLIK